MMSRESVPALVVPTPDEELSRPPWPPPHVFLPPLSVTYPIPRKTVPDVLLYRILIHFPILFVPNLLVACAQTALMTAAKLGLCVPRPEPGDEASSKPKTPQMALKEAMDIARKYAHPGGEVRVVMCWGCARCGAGHGSMTARLSDLLFFMLWKMMIFVDAFHFQRQTSLVRNGNTYG